MPEARRRVLLPLASDEVAGLVMIGGLGVAALGLTLDCKSHAPDAVGPESLELIDGLLELVGNWD